MKVTTPCTITRLLESLQGQNTPIQSSHLTTVMEVGQALPSSLNDRHVNPTSRSTKVNTFNDTRKYNIVLYGLKECEKGTNRSTRMKQELEQVTQILTGIEKGVNPQNIRDSFRLGKYADSNKRPRPVLVKLSRSYDVSSILANRQNLPKGLTIKPDLSPAERAVESLLMKERWQLIQSGQNKKDVKIYGSKIFLKGNLYGSVIDSKFVHNSPSNVTHQQEDNTTASHSLSMDTESSGN